MKKKTGYLNFKKTFGILTLCGGLLLTGCGSNFHLNVFQKDVPIPHNDWSADFHPVFDVKIPDTTSHYDLYITLRHTNSYPFSNLWIFITSGIAGRETIRRRVELPLADEEGQWFAKGIDDIYEHKVLIQENVKFDTAGLYHFELEQNMRIDPLPEILSVGMRVERETSLKNENEKP